MAHNAIHPVLCKQCGQTFLVEKYRIDTAEYCSLSCRSKGTYHKAKAGGFGSRTGCLPWNKGKKTGLVPKSAFKKGMEPWNKGTACLLKRRLSNTIKAAISRSVKGKKGGRRWETLVGWTLQDLMIHLEKKFVPGMSWDNYGEWHIDHKIPLAVFNFSDISHIDFKRAWALNNLQPLWAEDNLRKNDTIENAFQPSLGLMAYEEYGC